MSVDGFVAEAAAGSLRASGPAAVAFPHRWTADGVTVQADFTGAHLLHLAVAGCVLNDLYREAAGLGVELTGVRVRAAGAFDAETWASSGVAYAVELRSPASAEELAELLAVVDRVAEIPRAVRAGAAVGRVEALPLDGPARHADQRADESR